MKKSRKKPKFVKVVMCECCGSYTKDLTLNKQRDCPVCLHIGSLHYDYVEDKGE